MVITIIAYLVGLIISIIAVILPEWQVFPEKVFTAFENIVVSFVGLNNLFLVIPDILEASIFFLRFMFWLGLFLIIRKIFNFIRGIGQGI